MSFLILLARSRAAFSRMLVAAVCLTMSLSSQANPTVDDFMREADVRDVALSPDGKHLAMVVNKGSTRSVIVRNIEDPKMPLVGAYSHDVTRPNYLYWGNNNRLLIAFSVPYDVEQVEKDKAKNADFDIDDYFMFSRMIATDVDLSNSTILLEGERGLKRNISLSRVTNFVRNDDDHILMAAYRNGQRTQYRVNLYTGQSEEVTKGTSNTYGFLNDDNGKPHFRFDYLRGSESIVIYAYEDDGGWDKLEKIYLNRDDEDTLDSGGLVALYKGNLVYRNRNESTGFYELVIVDRETGDKSTLVSLPDQDVGNVLYDPRADQMIGYTIENDYVRHVYFDELQQQHYDAIASQIGNANFAISGVSQEGDLALIQSWAPDDPLSYYLWNSETRELKLLVRAYQGLANANLSVPAVTTFKARDGQPIRSYLLLPNDYSKGVSYPTVILPHGGPHGRSRAGYDDFAQFLSTRGYIVAQPNFRGSVGYGRDFEEAGYKQWGGIMQDDLADAVKFLTDQGLADPDRVCIVGLSYGGYAALMGAIKTPSLYTCAISMNGISHLADLIEHEKINSIDKNDWQRVLFDRIGDPKKDKALLDANSPELHADKIEIPVMLVAGTDDGVVPFWQTRRMERALKVAGAEYESIRLEGSGHNPFYYKDDKERVYNAVEAFLGKYLHRSD